MIGTRRGIGFIFLVLVEHIKPSTLQEWYKYRVNAFQVNVRPHPER